MLQLCECLSSAPLNPCAISDHHIESRSCSVSCADKGLSICDRLIQSSSMGAVLRLLQANFFKADADTAINEDDATFQARVNRAPTPSSR